MKIKMAQVVALAIAALGISVTAAANTVAWWHFDEADPGTVASDNTIASGTTPEVYAQPWALTDYHPSKSGEYLPVFAKPFHGLCVYDPVSCERRVNRAAMKFRTDSDGATPAYYGGCLIAGTGDGQLAACTKSITVEAFVCTTGGVFNTFAPIVSSLDGYDFMAEKWAIYMMADGTLALRFNGNVWYTGEHVGTATINDGSWHHVALTWDGTYLKIYVDYEQDKFKSGSVRQFSYNGTLSYGSSNSTRMGGYSGAAGNVTAQRRFNGLVDEVRISDVALSPDQFLRMQPADMDADEILRVSFSPGEYGVLLPDMNLADNLGPNSQKAYLRKTGGSASFDAADKAGATVGAGFSSVGFENDASLRLTTNGMGNAGCYIQAPGFSSRFVGNASTNYTIECFYKTGGEIRGPVSNRQTLLKLGADVWIANVVLCAQYPSGSGQMGDGSMIVSYRDQSLIDAGSSDTHWWDTTREKNLDDECWHHLAIVVDGDNSEVCTYVDGRLSKRRSGYVPAPLLNDSWAYSLYVGCGYGSASEPEMFLDGWIDNLRVTLRALAPEEFLAANPVGPDTASLVALFEQNFNFECASNAAFSVAGAGEARTGGNAPTFVRESRGAAILDGPDGVETVHNDWSVSMNASRVVFPPSPLFEADASTVEFWARFEGIVDGTGPVPADSTGLDHNVPVLRLARADCTNCEWQVYRRKDAENVVGLEIDGTTAEWTLPADVMADGKWHHYAFTFEPSSVDGDSTMDVTLYYDYELQGGQTVSKRPRRVSGHRLMIGEGFDDQPNFVCKFDVLRFTRGLLAPSRFIVRFRGGLAIVFR